MMKLFAGRQWDVVRLQSVSVCLRFKDRLYHIVVPDHLNMPPIQSDPLGAFPPVRQIQAFVQHGLCMPATHSMSVYLAASNLAVISSQLDLNPGPSLHFPSLGKNEAYTLFFG